MSNSQELKAKVQEYYDDAAMVYGDLYADYLSNEEDSIVGELLNKYLSPPSSSVLDLGCGDGLGYTLAHWKRYTGLDISSQMIKAATNAHPNVSFKIGDMEDLSAYPAGHFDAVMSTFGSFSHALYPGVTIEETFRVLKPGGRAFIMVYSQYSLRNLRLMFRKNSKFESISPIQEYKIRNLDMKGSFARFYSRKKLERLFFKYKVLKIGSINGFLELPLIKEKAQQNPQVAKRLKIDHYVTKLFPNFGHSMYIIVEKPSK